MIVERHNEIIRRCLQTTEQQLVKEGLKAPFEQALQMVFFMHDSLTVINNSTPYQALLGRQPAMLHPLEGGHSGQVESQSRLETNTRHHARVREIAAMNIIEATARARLVRADKHNTRLAAERLQFQPGYLCDIWFEPANKDQTGWRGPAEVQSINAADGNLSVRIQGRTLNRVVGEVREHIPYLVYATHLFPDKLSHMHFLQRHCEELESEKPRNYSILNQNSGWQTTNISR